MTSHTVGALGIRATLEAWTPAGDAWLTGLLGVLEANRASVVERVARDLPGVRLRTPEATYLAWLDGRELGLGDLSRFFFKQARVALAPGSDFGGETTAAFARLNFGTTPEVLDLVLDRMADALARRT